MYLRQQLEEQGYAFIEKYSPRLETLEVAEEIGQIAPLPNIDLVQKLTPKQVPDSGPNTYSGNYGCEDFPLHSDLAHWHEPPRYLLLRCKTGSREVSTTIVDGRKIVYEIGEIALSRALAIPRRPASNYNYLLRLLSKSSNRPDIFRWDELFIKPTNQASDVVFNTVSNYLSMLTPKSFFLEFLGDTLLVDNWRMLHGRSAVPSNSISRYIERVYLRNIN